MTFVGRIDLVQYMLGLSGNFNLHLVSPKYLRYIFVSLCSDNSLHLKPTPCYSEITTRAKTPTSCEIPTSEMPVVPLNRKNRLKSVGGTFVNYPTFRTRASLSHGSPLPSNLPTHSFIEAAKTCDETPHPAPSATQPEPLP